MNMLSKKTILNKTACVVAIELGYAEKAVLRCYKDGISAGDLVMDILNLHESDATSEVFSNGTNSNQAQQNCGNDINSVEFQQLKKETLELLKVLLCKKCLKCNASCVALPCCHLVVCAHCRDKQCIVCDVLVTDWIRTNLV